MRAVFFWVHSCYAFLKFVIQHICLAHHVQKRIIQHQAFLSVVYREKCLLASPKENETVPIEAMAVSYLKRLPSLHMLVEQLTDADILSLCAYLNASFEDGREFKPLDRVEGGIDCIWPGKRATDPPRGDLQGKTMAFASGDIEPSVWPHVGEVSWQKAAHEDYRETDWKPAVVLRPGRLRRPQSVWKLGLTFKWWGDGTPKWTKKEAEAVKDAFIALGFSKNSKKRARQQDAEEDVFGLSIQLLVPKKKMEHV